MRAEGVQVPGWERSDVAATEPSWLRSLEMFGIPFICYGSDASRSYVSSAARQLVNDDGGEAIALQADQAAAMELQTRGGSLHIGDFALTRQILAASGDGVLTVHRSRTAVASVHAVVVIRAWHTAPSNEVPVPGLSPRESQVARLIARGLATKEVAQKLSISTHTARHHTERVFAKLAVRTRTQVAIAMRAHDGVPHSESYDAAS